METVIEQSINYTIIPETNELDFGHTPGAHVAKCIGVLIGHALKTGKNAKTEINTKTIIATPNSSIQKLYQNFQESFR